MGIDFDISRLVSAIFMLKDSRQNEARREKCKSCLAKQKYFCNIRYQVDEWTEESDVCLSADDGLEKAQELCIEEMAQGCVGEPGAKCFIDDFRGCQEIQYRYLDGVTLGDNEYAFKKFS